MEATGFEGTRLARTYRQTIHAAPEAVFPLLCPVREVEWLEGWSCTMVYSASGLIEEGAVFTTSSDGEADTVWIVTRHDAAAGVVQFTRVTPGSRTCVLTIVVSPAGPGRTHVDVTYAYTSLSDASDEFLAAWTAEVFFGAMQSWEDSMNHFLRTGTRLARSAGT